MAIYEARYTDYLPLTLIQYSVWRNRWTCARDYHVDIQKKAAEY